MLCISGKWEVGRGLNHKGHIKDSRQNGCQRNNDKKLLVQTEIIICETIYVYRLILSIQPAFQRAGLPHNPVSMGDARVALRTAG
jgi:hypothetical protein